MAEIRRRAGDAGTRANRRQIAADDIMNLYLSEVGHIPLLSRQEEVELAARLRRGGEAEQKLRESGQLAPEEREQLEREIVQGGKARDELIKANSRLVMSIARRYAGQGVPFPDLVQEGTIGLISAIDRFDHRLGYKLSTYATWWIRQALTRAVAGQGRNIRLPVHRYENVRKLRRTSLALAQELGREPTQGELAEKVEMAEEKVEQLLKSAQPTVSLDTPVDEEGNSFLVQFVENEDAPPPGDLAVDGLVRSQIEDVLSGLTPREERILRLRFGLEDGHTHTLREIANKMGLTRERIRQIEGEALGRLRHPTRARKLRDFYHS